MMTVSPMTIRSNGFSSTLNGILVVSFSRTAVAWPPSACSSDHLAREMASRGGTIAALRKKAARFPQPPRCSCRFPDLAEQLEHALLGLVGQRQRGHRDRLAGGEGPAVRPFLVCGGHAPGGRAGLPHLDQG